MTIDAAAQAQLFAQAQALAQGGAYGEALTLIEPVPTAECSLDLLVLRLSLEMVLGYAEAACATADLILAQVPGAPMVLLNKQTALLQLGEADAALACAEYAQQLHPQVIEFAQNRAAALMSKGRDLEAIPVLQAVLAQAPGHPTLLINLASALLAVGRFEESLAELLPFGDSPQDPRVFLVRTAALCSLKRLGQAIAIPARLLEAQAFEAAVECLAPFAQVEFDALGAAVEPLAPGTRALLLSLLARQLLKAREYDATDRLLAVAERWWGDAWEPAALRAIGAAARGRIGEADSFFAAQSGEPLARLYALYRPGEEPPRDASGEPLPFDPATIYVDEQVDRWNSCDFRDYEARVATLEALARDRLARGMAAPIPPFFALVLPFDEQLRSAIARAHAAGIEAAVRVLHPDRRYHHTPGPRERLRIGYVSGDFRYHATAHLIRNLFACHDRAGFEVLAYSLAPSDGSSYRRHLERTCDRFLDVSDWTAAAIADRIAADGVDILVDLHGHTKLARLALFALRPAPINVTWLGYPGTSGATFMDYVVADEVVLPGGMLSHYSESPIYMPSCYQINDRWQAVADGPVSRTEEGLPEQGTVFAAINRADKLEPGIFGRWMEILSAVPGSVLWLLGRDELYAQNLRREAAARGVDPERLRFARFRSKEQHLRRLALADLFLDTLIYNAHTAASDALWAGVPLLTCPGAGFASRVGASLLQSLELPDLIAADPDDYVARAIRLGRDRQALRELRARVESRRLSTSLFDTERFVRDLERGLRQAWQRFQAGLAPAVIRV